MSRFSRRARRLPAGSVPALLCCVSQLGWISAVYAYGTAAL